MRVLTVTSLFPRSTAPTHGIFIAQRVRALARAGAEVRVVSPLPWIPPGPVPDRYARMRATPVEETWEGIPVRHPRYPMLPRIGMRWQAHGYARGLRRVLRDEIARHRPDLVDAHYLYPDAVGVARACDETGLPYVCTARGSDVHVLAAFRSLHRPLRRALAGAAHVIAVSNDLAATLRERGLVDSPVAVVPNGIDAERFRPGDRDEACRELELPAGVLRVLCVGSLVPVHGQDLLVEALAQPALARDDLHVHLLGDGPLGEPLRERVRALGLAERVHFEGVVPHERVPAWIRASDVTVQLSRSAGSPNAVLESIACGVPVLASDIAAMREAIRHPAQGRLVARDPHAAAEGLAGLLADPSPMPEECTRVRAWDGVAADLLELFAGAVGGNA